MTIVLSEYNQNWPQMFEEEKAYLLTHLEAFLAGSIEHVGSTSVMNMVAKPVIDIMFGVKSLEQSVAAISILEKAGYCYYPYKADVMHWFCKPSPDIRTHHLHLVPYDSVLWRERIAFRERLKNDLDAFEQYKNLKVQLARDVGDDRELYTQRKTPFIMRVLESVDS